MQLGAFEFIASQEPSDPGVLVLSNNTGAAEILKDGSITYDPKDSKALAGSFERALRMPKDERLGLHGRGLAEITANDAEYWAKANMSALERIRPHLGQVIKMPSRGPSSPHPNRAVAPGSGG